MITDSSSVSALDVALRVAAAIESVGGAYFVGGSLASSLQGEPRATNDIDIVLRNAASGGSASSSTPSVSTSKWTRTCCVRRCARDRPATCSSCRPCWKVHLFAVGPDPYDGIEFSRRRPVIVRPPDTLLVVKSPEDSVLRKLWWYRKGGEVSERQWRDVVQVLRFAGNAMDVAYLDRWASELSVADLLARARSSVAEGT